MPGTSEDKPGSEGAWTQRLPHPRVRAKGTHLKCARTREPPARPGACCCGPGTLPHAHRAPHAPRGPSTRDSDVHGRATLRTLGTCCHRHTQPASARVRARRAAPTPPGASDPHRSRVHTREVAPGRADDPPRRPELGVHTLSAAGPRRPPVPPGSRVSALHGRRPGPLAPHYRLTPRHTAPTGRRPHLPADTGRT